MLSERAAELGRLIGQSNEYQAVKRANEAMSGDSEALGLLKQMALNKEITVVIITHKFREVTQFADAVTVLRRGKHVGGGSGQCHSCGGTGQQTKAEIRRNVAYNRFKLREVSLVARVILPRADAISMQLLDQDGDLSAFVIVRR